MVATEISHVPEGTWDAGHEPRVGVLAVQGAFMAHAAMLARIGVRPVIVREPDAIAGLHGLVLPGGESTTMTLLMQANGLWSAVGAHIASGAPVLATCAGTILLAQRILDGRQDQDSLAVVDITVRRNGFGRQAESFEAPLDIPGEPPMKGVFIRAPVIEETGPGVDVLARVGAPYPPTPALCRSGNIFLTTFHPELTHDTRVHRAAFGPQGGTRTLADRDLIAAAGQVRPWPA